VILVIASELDEIAEAAVTDWPSRNAILMKPLDLCTQGWRIEVGRTHEGMLIANGRLLPVTHVTGVLNRLSFVDERELVAIEPSDRRYVAAELTAFVFYFLSQLPCRMINRPTVNNLAGCDWRLQEWAHYGQEQGIPFVSQSMCGHASSQPAGQLRRTAILNDAIVLSNDDQYPRNVAELVRRAGLVFADVCYLVRDHECLLHSVSLVPDLSSPEMASAVHRYFRDH
jgi:hypothetical protein